MALKVVLAQLPNPSYVYNLGLPYSNPIGIYTLKAMAYKEKLLGLANVLILDPPFINNAGDYMLVKRILQEEPDIIGFSCYCWNIKRSLYIASEVKNNLKGTKIIIGGPEITVDCLDSLYHPSVDIGVIGEGEETFTDLLKYFLGKGNQLNKIEGIAYKFKNKIILNPARKPVENLDEIPSPLLLEYMLPAHYPLLAGIEGMRGCPFSCKHCYYSGGGHKTRFFSSQRIKEEITLIRKSTVNRKILRLYAGSFNAYPYQEMRKLAKAVGDVNKDGLLSISTAVRLEIMERRQAELLSAAGIRKVSVGLRSQDINTKSKIKRFLKGIDVLLTSGIHPVIDGYVIGLPEDTPELINKTFNFLIKYDLAKDSNLFPLHLLPGTSIRKDAKRLGIKFNPLPPYNILSTNNLLYKDIREAIMQYEKISPYGIYRYINKPLPDLFYYSNNKINCKLIKNTNNAVNKIAEYYPNVFMVIFELKENKWTKEKMTKVSEGIAKIAQNKLTIWFKTKDANTLRYLSEEVCSCLFRFNPYLTCYIIIETDFYLDRNFLSKINNIITVTADNYLDMFWSYRAKYPLDKVTPDKIFLLLSAEKSFKTNWLLDASLAANIIWQIDISSRFSNYKELIKKTFNKKGEGILINFHHSLGKKDIFNILLMLHDIVNYPGNNKEIRFKDWSIQQIWNSLQNRSYLFAKNPNIFSGTAVNFDERENIEIFCFQENNLLADLAEWKFYLMKNGKNCESI